MDRDRFSRRNVLGLTASVGAVSIAGCTGADDDDDDVIEQELNPDDWEDVREIELEGYTNGWVGVEPDLIANVRNPTIILFEGEDYEITWENGDGLGHNIELQNEESSVVDGHRTQIIRERGERQTLEFEATDPIHKYVCAPHPRSMTGYIRTISE